MLRDAAHVQKSELEYVNKLRAKKGMPPAKPLYDLDDVEEAIKRTVGIHLHREIFISEKVSITFLNAGHLLGAALTVLRIRDGSKEIKLGYTGDLGRRGMPLLEDPEQIGDVDYLISESTYGNRRHPPLNEAKELLEKVINEAWKEGGKVIVPAFSVERTQDLLYTLYQLQEEEKIPEIPIFIDSPLSVNATEIFFSHPEFLRDEVKEMIYRGEDPFHLKNVEFVRSAERSKQLNRMEGPAIIMSASGMCEAGRILHHLHNHIEDPRTRILIVGFMAKHTLGRKLAENSKEVRIFGEPHVVRAKIHVFHNFSSHADSEQLFSFISKVKRAGRLKKVFLTHGEPEQSLPLKKRLEEAGIEVYYPDEGEEFSLE
jgi:metallo-beta-lactamase family protein